MEAIDNVHHAGSRTAFVTLAPFQISTHMSMCSSVGSPGASLDDLRPGTWEVVRIQTQEKHEDSRYQWRGRYPASLHVSRATLWASSTKRLVIGGLERSNAGSADSECRASSVKPSRHDRKTTEISHSLSQERSRARTMRITRCWKPTRWRRVIPCSSCKVVSKVPGVALTDQ